MAQDYIIPRQVNTDECWLYAGFIDVSGYGSVFDGTKQHRAHRVMYENTIGPIPDGLVTDHLCRVRCCINPDHLEPVTNATNILRGVSPSAQNARRITCHKGHDYTATNTKMRKNGWRICLVCKRNYEKLYRERHHVLL